MFESNQGGINGTSSEIRISDTVDVGIRSAEGTVSEVWGVDSSLAVGLRLSTYSENITQEISPNHANGDDGTDVISALLTHYGQEVPSLQENKRTS